MAIVVEDGSGLPNAATYLSATDAATTAANWGRQFNAGEPDAEPALRISAQWLDATFIWPGARLNDAQGLAWPRGEAGIPERVKAAQAVAAAFLQANADALVPVVVPGEMEKQVRVGPVMVSYASASGVLDQVPVLTLVDYILDGVGIRRRTVTPIFGEAGRG